MQSKLSLFDSFPSAATSDQPPADNDKSGAPDTASSLLRVLGATAGDYDCSFRRPGAPDIAGSSAKERERVLWIRVT